MKPINRLRSGKWIAKAVHFTFATAAIVTMSLWIENPAKAAGIVANCAEASLRAAMAGGGKVTFACDGTISLSGTITNSHDTVLDGAGHQITISGGNAVSVRMKARRCARLGRLLGGSGKPRPWHPGVQPRRRRGVAGEPACGGGERVGPEGNVAFHIPLQG